LISIFWSEKAEQKSRGIRIESEFRIQNSGDRVAEWTVGSLVRSFPSRKESRGQFSYNLHARAKFCGWGVAPDH
jgi:hypothetical protein